MISRCYRSGLASLLPAALVAAVAASVIGRPVQGQRIATGATAPTAVVDANWQIRAPHGAATTLGNYRGKVVFLHVWATWCVVCKPELASIARLHRIVTQAPFGGDVAFLLVSPESDRIVARYMARHALAPYVFVEAQAAPRALGLTALPVTLILDRDGAIVARHQGLGAWDAPAFVTALQELVQHTAVAPSVR